MHRRTILGLVAVALSLALGAPAQAVEKNAASGKDAKATVAQKVDLNTASAKELEDLPGVGPATAKKIIAGRPYASVADLSKAGVSAKTITEITPLVTVSALPAASPAAAKAPTAAAPAKPAKAAAAPSGPVDLNTASQKQLEELPGVGPATAKKIIAGRPYASAAELTTAGVPAKTIAQITPMVTVGTPAKPAAPAATATAPAATASAATPATTAVPPPAKGMVWVNTETKVYHREGDRWYGKTKQGKYMTEADAIAAGYHASKEGAKKTQP